MFDQETIQFASDDELRKPIPDKTVARIQVRPGKDGQLGDFLSGESKFGPWVMVPCEVVDGDHRGEWASLMLSIKGTDRRFRAVVQAVMGIDIGQGNVSMSFGDFKDALVGGVFEAELGPERRRGEPTGFNTVSKLLRRVGDRHLAAAPATSSGAGGLDDLPF